MHRLPLVLVLPLFGCGCVQDSPSLSLALNGLLRCTGFPPILVLTLLGCGFGQASHSLGLAFAGLWLCTGFPQSSPLLACGFAQASPVLILPLLGFGYEQASPDFVLPLLAFGFAQASPGLGLGLPWLWLWIGFPCSWFCICWAVVVNRLSTVLVQNLATRSCGGTVVYPGGFQIKFQGGFAFYPVSLTCIV